MKNKGGRPTGSKGKTIVFNKKCMEWALCYRKTTIYQLGKNKSVGKCLRTLRTYMSTGKMPEEILQKIAHIIDIDPDYLKGVYYNNLSKSIHDKNLLWYFLNPRMYPYEKKELESVTYIDYIKPLLLIHDISWRQYEALADKEQWAFQYDLEKAIIPVLLNHFHESASGRPINESCKKLKTILELYGPDYEETPDPTGEQLNEWFNLSDNDSYLEEKFGLIEKTNAE